MGIEKDMNANPERSVTSNPDAEKRAKSLESQSGITKKVLVARLAGALLAAATVGVNVSMAVKYHNDFDTPNTIPGIMENVYPGIPTEWKMLIADWQKNQAFGSDNAPVSPIFDNTSKVSVIKIGTNSKPLDGEELAKITENITSTPNEKLPSLKVLPPFVLEEGDQVRMSRTIMTVDTTDPSGKKIEPSFNYLGGRQYVVAKAGKEMTPGIIDPKAISFKVFKNPPLVLNGKEYFGGIVIRVERSDGIKYAVSLSSPNDVRSLAPLPLIESAPTVDQDPSKWLTQEGGVKIPSGTTNVMKTNIDNAIVNEVFSIISAPNFQSNMPFFSDVQMFESSGKILYLPQDK